MGCGESKHDVVTGNTVLHRKQSDNTSAKNSARDIETVHEKPAADQLSQSGIKDDSAVVSDAANVKKEDDDENTTKLRDDDKKEILVEAQIGPDSPNHFFSSRKDEELGIDGIISEGRSGKSEYNTPRHGDRINKDDSVLGPDHHANQDLKEAVEENNKDSLARYDQEIITQAEKENEKAVNEEENLVKEEAEMTKVEEKDLKPAEEEKSSTQKDEEKHVVG